EVVLVLVHVGEIVRTGKIERGEIRKRDADVTHGFTQHGAELRGHLGAGQVFARDPESLADDSFAATEQAERAGANVASGNAGQLAIAHRQKERESALTVAA